MLTVLVTLAAGIGALARYLVDTAVQRRVRTAFPSGTFLINVTGSLLLGLLTGLVAHHGLSTATATVLGTGFAGGYTTLSTWAWETISLARDGERGVAALNVTGSFLAGLLAAAAGLGLALLG